MAEIGSMHEPVREVRDDTIGLYALIEGHCPVQVFEGKLGGLPFYFRARWAGWEFIVSLSPAIDAATLNAPNRPGYFVDDKVVGYVQCGDYGTTMEAGWMPYTVAERIIRDCAAAFLTAGPPPNPLGPP